jgi:uncharacterized protein (DUF4213/DUF364 family)
LASVLRTRCFESEDEVPIAGGLTQCSAQELAHWLGSPSLIRSSIGMAAYNALLEVDEAACTVRNAEDLIVERGAERRVAIVGHFPFTERVRKTAAECWVLELEPVPGDLPAEQASDVIPEADVVALTGTSLLNGTFDGLMALCRDDAYVIVLGPSTPLSPVLLDVGADAVCGTLVTDADRVVQAVSQGAHFRQIKQAGGVSLLTLEKTGEDDGR